jgi:hypothetical protein
MDDIRSSSIETIRVFQKIFEREYGHSWVGEEIQGRVQFRNSDYHFMALFIQLIRKRPDMIHAVGRYRAMMDKKDIHKG